MKPRLLAAALALIAALAIIAPAMQAQDAPYKFDFGVSAGMSGYLGDVNESNMFRHPGVAASVDFHYIGNTRWSILAKLGFQTLSGNSADWQNVFPDGRVYSFKSMVADIEGMFEFNFFPYGIGETYKRLRRWTPYVGIGIGASVAKAKDVDGMSAGINIPMAVGIRYKIGNRTNLHLAFKMTKVLSDRVDGEITDLYGIQSSFLKNNDWYSSITAGITFEFGKRCETCHRID